MYFPIFSLLYICQSRFGTCPGGIFYPGTVAEGDSETNSEERDVREEHEAHDQPPDSAQVRVVRVSRSQGVALIQWTHDPGIRHGATGARRGKIVRASVVISPCSQFIVGLKYGVQGREVQACPDLSVDFRCRNGPTHRDENIVLETEKVSISKCSLPFCELS